MGRTCDMVGCTNSNYKTKAISYHSLPSDELLRGKWLDAINANGGFRQSKTRKKTHNCDNTYVCGVHFSDDCYVSTAKQKHLKPTAIPTFPPVEKRGCHEKTKSKDPAEDDNYRISVNQMQLQMTYELSEEDSPKVKQTVSTKSKMKKVIANKSKKSRSPILSGDLSDDIIQQCRRNSMITHLSHNDGVPIMHPFTSATTQPIEISSNEGESATTLEQLESDISNGYRTLETIDLYLQQLFQEKQELEHEEALMRLFDLKEEIHSQLVHRKQEQLTKEMAWTEEQESVYDLQRNLVNDDKNVEHLREMEKILAEREEEIRQLRQSTNDEICTLEEKLKSIERRISEFKENRISKLEELLSQESILQMKKKDHIEDLKQKIDASKVLEIKLIQLKARERLHRLNCLTL
ncbi:uncharacterized protein LOC130700120 [Daphnia carinata]|uniref:uncharacterized protein LOC130700120 n=1 Tax=Daphnia carinata TaxID=120202 RepID=UPI00257F949A|nr:uncharacterized protein LOC130700120 [Daphnia carinata]